jgi:hypothetical protein
VYPLADNNKGLYSASSSSGKTGGKQVILVAPQDVGAYNLWILPHFHDVEGFLQKGYDRYQAMHHLA